MPELRHAKWSPEAVDPRAHRREQLRFGALLCLFFIGEMISLFAVPFMRQSPGSRILFSSFVVGAFYLNLRLGKLRADLVETLRQYPIDDAFAVEIRIEQYGIETGRDNGLLQFDGDVLL